MLCASITSRALKAASEKGWMWPKGLREPHKPLESFTEGIPSCPAFTVSPVAAWAGMGAGGMLQPWTPPGDDGGAAASFLQRRSHNLVCSLGSLCYHTHTYTYMRTHTHTNSIKRTNPRLYLLLLKAPLICRGSKQLGVYKV